VPEAFQLRLPGLVIAADRVDGHAGVAVLELVSVTVIVTVSERLSKVLMMNVPPERVIGLPVNCTLAELALRSPRWNVGCHVLLFTSWAVTVTLNAVRASLPRRDRVVMNRPGVT